MFLNEVFIHVFEVINFVSTVFIMFALPLRTLNICVFDHPVFFLQNSWVCLHLIWYNMFILNCQFCFNKCKSLHNANLPLVNNKANMPIKLCDAHIFGAKCEIVLNKIA